MGSALSGRLFKAAIASRENFKYVLAAENLHVDSQVDEKPIGEFIDFLTVILFGLCNNFVHIYGHV